MPKRIEFLANFGVDEVAVYDLVPVGRGKDVMDHGDESRAKSQSNTVACKRMQEDTEMVFTMSGGIPLYPEIAMEMHRHTAPKPKTCSLKSSGYITASAAMQATCTSACVPTATFTPARFYPSKSATSATKV